MHLLILTRGLPGSGKTTLANKLMCEIEDTPVFSSYYSVNMYSTDDFWYDELNSYKFDITRIGEAHQWNFDRVKFGITEYDVVIVDNTNIVWKDFKKYIVLAIENGYDIMLAEPKTDWQHDVNECDTKNTHNVPKATIERMLHKYQSNAEIIGYAKGMMDGLGRHVDIYEYDPLELM